jgi:hypothetical protein
LFTFADLTILIIHSWEAAFKKHTIFRTDLGGLATHLVAKYEHRGIRCRTARFAAAHPEAADWLGISEYTLILAGETGCVLKYLLA